MVPGNCAEKLLVNQSRIFAEFQALNRSMTVEVANVFLLVCVKEGQRLADYARDTGLVQSTISRYLLDLTEYRRDLSEAGQDDGGRKPGYGLVRSEVDPQELRTKRYYLTPKGRALRDRILGIIAGEVVKGPYKAVVVASRH